ncbi:MAG: hypothetical protein SEPTF4163_002196 [Sporothrix epigloea]
MAPSIMRLALALSVAILSHSVQAVQEYSLEKTYDASNFFDEFTFIDTIDLSHGYVSYVDQQTAVSDKIANITGNTVYLGVDSTTKLHWPNDLGRKSVRIEGHDEYSQGLFVASFAHFPKPACGAWPAFWMYGPDWPNSGEIDIYESWNEATFNEITFHSSTTSTCALQEDPFKFTGTIQTSNCNNAAANYVTQYPGQGCVTEEVGAGSTSPFGNAQGGIYAVEFTADYIKIWSWTHGAAPADINSAHPDPSGWGLPRAHLSKPGCAITNYIKNQHFVFDIDFCGDAAGNNFGACAAANPGYAASPQGCAAFIGLPAKGCH